MTSDRDLILSAFVDGETVEPEELVASLASPGARETLLAFVALRLQVRQELADPPGDVFPERARRALVRASPPGSRWWLGAGAAAAVVLVLALTTRSHRQDPQAAAPAPDLPREATRVVRFEPGVDWHPLPAREEWR